MQGLRLGLDWQMTLMLLQRSSRLVVAREFISRMSPHVDYLLVQRAIAKFIHCMGLQRTHTSAAATSVLPL